MNHNPATKLAAIKAASVTRKQLAAGIVRKSCNNFHVVPQPLQFRRHRSQTRLRPSDFWWKVLGEK
jgi:hypothetical protein